MRLFISTALLIAAANFAIFVITPLFRADRSPQQEAVNAAYRDAPDATLRKMAASYKSCAKSKLHDTRGAAEFRTILAKRILSEIASSESETSRNATWDRGIRSLFDRLDENGRTTIINYTEDLKHDGVAGCVISSLI